MTVYRNRTNEKKRRNQPGRDNPESGATLGAIVGRVSHAIITKEDLAARLAEIPPDTRTLTARYFGDPLPGRSAFDRAHGSQRQGHA